MSCRPDEEDLAELGEPAATVYRGAAAACRAAFYGESRRWSAAERALRRAPRAGAGPLLTCYGETALRALREIVKIHRADPAVVIVRAGHGRGLTPPCAFLNEIQPDHGAFAGGYRVRLIGVGLPAIATIHFGRTMIRVRTDGTEAELTVPNASDAMDEDQSVDEGVAVWVDESDDPSSGTLFTYDPEDSSSAPHAPTLTTSPAPDTATE